MNVAYNESIDVLTLKTAVVIIIPIYKDIIGEMEKASLQQLVKITQGRYPIRLVAPAGLNVSCYMEIIPSNFDVETEEFPSKYFRGTNGYNKLFVNKLLYQRIAGWEYVLIYHLDAFLFDDKLEDWCKEGYDSIGAPIYVFDGTNKPTKYLGTGNGGFCLRNIRSCLEVLHSCKTVYPYNEIKKDFLKYNFRGKISRSIYYLDMITSMGNRTLYSMNRIRVNEDYFWSVLVPARFKWFKVPARLEAAKFSLEYNQESLFLENGNILPFGCHGWYGPILKEFWKPIFKTFNIEII